MMFAKEKKQLNFLFREHKSKNVINMGNVIDELKYKLTWEYLNDSQNIEEKFKSIANILLGEVAIEKKGRLYYMTDVEFYWYTNNHRDIITYPRNCKAGQWFFHSSGVDISFESEVKQVGEYGRMKPFLDETAMFGGILIRGIRPAYEDKSDKDCNLNGPLKVQNYLFDMFDAFGDLNQVPKIVEASHKFNLEPPTVRTNLLVRKSAKEKVKSILSNNYKQEDISEMSIEELRDEFEKFMDKPYKFFTK